MQISNFGKAAEMAQLLTVISR